MQKLNQIKLVRVQYIPKVLEAGCLYVSEQYGSAVHLCACGCGAKVSTPLRPTEWAFEETVKGPSLTPSVGNWQLPCRSHYWINKGNIVWSEDWMPDQVAAGRRTEEVRRSEYYDSKGRKRVGILQMLIRWLRWLFGNRPKD